MLASVAVVGLALWAGAYVEQTGSRMAVAAAGHVSGMQTTKLLTGPESVKAMKRARAAAQSYPTPKGK